MIRTYSLINHGFDTSSSDESDSEPDSDESDNESEKPSKKSDHDESKN